MTEKKAITPCKFCGGEHCEATIEVSAEDEAEIERRGREAGEEWRLEQEARSLAAKPCPFCGSVNNEFSGDANAITCGNTRCMAQGPDVSDEEIEELAWKKWDARTDERVPLCGEVKVFPSPDGDPDNESTARCSWLRGHEGIHSWQRWHR